MTDYTEGSSVVINMLDWLDSDLDDVQTAINGGDTKRAVVGIKQARDVQGALRSLLTQLLPHADEMARRLPARMVQIEKQKHEARRLAGELEAGADPLAIVQELRRFPGGDAPPPDVAT